MTALNEAALNTLFLEARTHNAWQDRTIDDALLKRIYELTRMAPTAANNQPLRVVFVKSTEAKNRLRPAVNPTNLDKTMNAPATAIIAYDLEFYEQYGKLFPSRDLRSHFASLPKGVIEQHASLNATLQAGYFIMAARALGLDCGPMGGFDRSKVDAEFFPDGKRKSLLLINLGYGDPDKLFPRNPRLDFEEACRIE